jgi:hypothetical protein
MYQQFQVQTYASNFYLHLHSLINLPLDMNTSHEKNIKDVEAKLHGSSNLVLFGGD